MPTDHLTKIARIILSVLVGSFLTALSADAAPTPQTCVKEYLASIDSGQDGQGISPPDAELLISKIASKIGLASGVKVLECDTNAKAYAWIPSTTDNIPDDLYVIYNPDWVHNVIGRDQIQAVALFGHELGHFLNFHFTTRRNLARIEKEEQADRFAGCAVARMYGSDGWSKLENLLERLRAETDTSYPSRLRSLNAAKVGFEGCGGDLPYVSTDNEQSVGWAYYGRILDSAWDTRHFNIDGGGSRYPRKKDEINAIGDVNLREGMIRFVNGEWTNAPKIGLIKTGERFVVLDVAEPYPDFVWVRVGR